MSSVTTFRGRESLFNQVIKVVGAELIGQLKFGLKQIPTLAGPPGIGKTASLVALGQALNFKVVVYQLSAKSPEEFSGIPDFVDADVDFVRNWSTTGAKSGKFTVWSIPELVANVNKLAMEKKADGSQQNVMLIFDDIHMADPALERYLFNLFLDKVVGEYKLADNVVAAAAMNTTDSSGFTGFNSAILDRLSVYKVKFDFFYWYNIVGHKLHDFIASFLRAHADSEPQLILGKETIDEVSPTPRSWTELARFIDTIESKELKESGLNLELNRNLLTTIAKARVGDTAAAKLAEFHVIYTRYNFERIIKEQELRILNHTDVIEQTLFGYLVKYAKTKQDGEFVSKFIEANKTAGTFTTSILREFVLRYKHSTTKSPAIQYLYEWLVNSNLAKEMNQALADISPFFLGR